MIFVSDVRGGSRAAATSKMERFLYHKALHLGCCSSPRSASGYISHYLNTFAERVRDRYLKNNVSKSIIHVISISIVRFIEHILLEQVGKTYNLWQYTHTSSTFYSSNDVPPKEKKKNRKEEKKCWKNISLLQIC